MAAGDTSGIKKYAHGFLPELVLADNFYKHEMNSLGQTIFYILT